MHPFRGPYVTGFFLFSLSFISPFFYRAVVSGPIIRIGPERVLSSLDATHWPFTLTIRSIFNVYHLQARFYFNIVAASMDLRGEGVFVL
jgi:hypothetical protein